MNCDLVFDILTRGPFPSGAPTDAAVERHLGCCHECRQLAEALRPAVELFHECINADESVGLPGYRGSLAFASEVAPSNIATATRVQPAVVGSLIRPAWRVSSPARSAAMRMAAAGVLLVAVCVLLFGLGRGGDSDDKASLASAAGAAPPVFQADLRETLASFHLPDDCFAPLTTHVETAQHGAQCCTRCHAHALSHTPNMSQRRLADLARSCQACHES